MALWQTLYAMVWLLFADFLVLLLYNRPPEAATWLHIALGVGVIGLGYRNWKGLEASQAPARLKRISKTTFSFAVAQAVVGLLIFLGVSLSVGLFPAGVLGAVHILLSFAMITQASSVATAYDMWEEGEYAAVTPGIPPSVAPLPHFPVAS